MRRVVGKKLLVAAVGVAAVAYGACKERTVSGNLMAPEPTSIPVGNLMAPIPDDAGVIGPPVAPDAGEAPADGGAKDGGGKDGGAKDGGAKDGDAGAKKLPKPPNHHPPGNLMAPE